MTIDEPVRVSVRIDDDNPKPISTDLWGIFFEDINYSADGGLYAELIRNRSFSFSAADQPDWNALTGWSTDGSVELGKDADLPVLLVADTNQASITNHGFDGILVRAGERYVLELRAAGLTPDAQLDVALLGSDGAELAASSIALSAESVSHQLILTAAAGDSDARLRVTLRRGHSAVGYVSLFPEQTHGGPNGFRSDLAHAIAELRPRFVRFPGGCIAHGMGLPNMYHWKETLGPVEGRKQNFNLWGYHQSMGIGYYEYFRFCAQIGAKPLPVVAAGVCCQNVPGGQQAIPEAEFGAYIQDVLDLIEYANGPSTSRWGQLRAEAGHPEPFGMEYLAIGNEDEISDQFVDRFGRLLDAVRDAHPEITIIGTAGPFPFGADYDRGWEIARRMDVPIVDEHSYKAPSWYFQNLDRYDHYDRSGPAVYIGEYGSRGNTMLCALAEAAYMMGMERNGDIVRLSSYAPLLAKIDRTQWVPDLIYFDNERVLPTLNYHVQRMHSLAAGDASLPVKVEGVPPFVRERVERAGVAVKARTGTVEISGARIGADPVDLHVQGGDQFAFLPISTDEPDYTVFLHAKLIDGSHGFVVAFGAVDKPDGAFEWHFGTWENRFYTLQKRSDGFIDDVVDPVPLVPSTSGYDIEIRVTGRGKHIVCLVGGEVIQEFTDPEKQEQRVIISSVSRASDGTIIAKAVNATGRAVILDLALESGRQIGGAEIISLSAEPDAGEPFEAAPSAPKRAARADISEGVVVEAYSFTTIRFNTED